MILNLLLIRLFLSTGFLLFHLRSMAEGRRVNSFLYKQLEGSVRGETWKYVSGKIEEDSAEYKFILVGQEVDDLDSVEADHIDGSVPQTEGSYEVGLNKDAAVDFYVDGEEVSAASGLVEVIDVTGTLVRLGFNVRIDLDNQIKGEAALPLVTD